MKQVRGSYVIDVDFVEATSGGGVRKLGNAVITVDSGAEESVCPPTWGDAFGMSPVLPGCEMKMINAAGDRMPHYGSRKVHFAVAGF